jgi:polyisoprenoid-binding protein YceI
MKSISFFSVIMLAFVVLAFNAPKANFKVDVDASTVTWKGKKLTGEHAGGIKVKKGSLDIDKKNKLTGGEFEIDMNSITCTDLADATYNGKLVGHLKSDDFFGVAKFPTAKLKITKVTAKSGNDYEVTANLTIKDKTNEITFPATVTADGKKAEATAKLVVNRSKFDVRYGSKSFFEDIGDKMIYDDFDLEIKLSAKK